MEARLAEGSVLEGKYRIIRVIGRGGMGVVYEAEHLFLKRRCAVKVLAPAKANDEAMISRFKIEARSAANIVHPNVVEVLDFGISPEGLPFFVMEYLDGEGLGDRIKRMRRLPPAVTVEYADQILRALSKAHSLGVVHRDLKPDNIFITAIDEVHEVLKVLDFGIAKLLDNFDAASDTAGVGRPTTVRGVVLGTPGYIAPESIFGLSTIDGRADLFSVGVLLYEMLTGKRPFVGDNAHDVLVATLSNPPIAPRALRPELSEAMERLVLIALAKSPVERFSNAEEFLDYLTAAAVGHIPEGSRGLPTNSAGPWSLGKEQVAENGAPLPAEETRPLSRPQIAANISAVLRRVPGDQSVVGALPLRFDEKVSSTLGNAETPYRNDAPLATKDDGSGLELDLEAIRRSGVPLPSWSPESDGSRALRKVPGWREGLSTRALSSFKLLRLAIIAGIVLALMFGARFLSRWFLEPDVVVGISSPSDKAATPSRMPRIDVAPPSFEPSPWKATADQVTVWIDVVPSNAKVLWAGQEMTERPLVVRKGDSSVELVVSAPGRKSARLIVVPSHEQSLRIELEPTGGGLKGQPRRKR